MTDWIPRSPGVTLIRMIFAVIDQIVYKMITWVYEIFFTIAGVDFLGGDIVRSIYSRVQLILGVFMIFKLAVSILQGIVSPDAVLDKKRGMGTIVTRIIVSLLMLSLIAPMNISNASNEWEQQVNDNGLLFGTLYSLQNRILSNNTIGRLIVGSNTADEMTSSQSLSETGNLFSNTVLRTFIGINVKEDSTTMVCPNMDSSILEIYNDQTAAPGKLLSIVNIGCDKASGNSSSLFSDVIQEFIGTEQYAFSYYFGVSTIAGVVILVILIGYSVDVAVRVFKLAILRLVAPIPIIAHINISAKEGKGEDAFGSWTRALISTYLDLFIRLAVIYFGLFIVQAICINGFELGNNHTSSAIANAFAGLFIIIGLMFFIKQAPNYIKSVLGIKPGPGSIGMNAMAVVAGNIQAGTPLRSLRDAQSMLGTVNEAIAKQNFGDKSEGHGLLYTTRKDAIKKIKEDYDRDLHQEFYKRGLDIDDYNYNIKDADGNVIGTVQGLDYSDYKKHLFEDAKAVKATQAATALSNNKARYSARMNTHAPSDGRGVTARSGDTEHTAAYTPQAQYMYKSPPTAPAKEWEKTPRYSDMPRRGSNTPPPDSSKNPPSTPPTGPTP